MPVTCVSAPSLRSLRLCCEQRSDAARRFEYVCASSGFSRIARASKTAGLFFLAHRHQRVAQIQQSASANCGSSLSACW